MKEDEQKWLEQAKAGSYDGFEKLAKAYEGSIFNFALKMCGHVEDAKDVLQETLLAAFQSLRGFRGESKLSTWFFKVAMSACHKMRRRGKFQPDYDLSLEELLPGLEKRSFFLEANQSPEETVSESEREKYLNEAIRAIPLRYRLVLVLRDIQEFSTEEVSEILKLSVPLVKVRLHRARLFLRQKLQEYLNKDLPKTRSERRVMSSDCRETARLLSNYLEADLDETLCRIIMNHMDGCDACLSLCRSLKRTLSLCQRGKRKRMPISVRREVHALVQRKLSKGYSIEA